MYIKRIYNIKNYKGLPDDFSVDFDDLTYIVGDNAKNKTTIGSLPLWILTGYNLFGSNKENVSNDANKTQKNTLASMILVDNNGSEHTITRCKGKDNFVLLDEIRTTQEILARFYKDVHAFICAYNPNYFRSMKLSEQRELLLRILPQISSDEAFNLLESEEKDILEKPIVDIKGFCKQKRADIKELNSELDKITGNKDAYISIAIEKEEETKIFQNKDKLEKLEKEYEKLISNTDEIISLGDLENNIRSLDSRISSNINDDLKEYQEDLRKEIDNLKNVSSTSQKCPTCKQKIVNQDVIESLKIRYTNKIKNIAGKIEKLKKETKELTDKKNNQILRYKRLKTPEIQTKAQNRDELKKKIDSLKKEKQEIDLYNKEVAVKHNNIAKAKKMIEQLENEENNIKQMIEKYSKQIQIATRLNLIIIQEQMKKVSEYLDKVTIEFSKVDDTTGEILDVYEVKYDGRNYEKLSKSYKIRADIEIAKLINKITEINTPMFIDDVESITQISLDPNIQTVLSIVIKYNELEILYSYQDVLQREKESIDKKIENCNNILENAA